MAVATVFMLSILLFSAGGADIPRTDWPAQNRDLAGTRYSPLTQINTKNVANLKQVWER
jgi:quinoprotein glucose dehydrogenase